MLHCGEMLAQIACSLQTGGLRRTEALARQGRQRCCAGTQAQDAPILPRILHQHHFAFARAVELLDEVGIVWDAWSDEDAAGQIELNLAMGDLVDLVGTQSQAYLARK